MQSRPVRTQDGCLNCPLRGGHSKPTLRRESVVLAAEFEASRPKIFAGILDLMAMVLKNLEEQKLGGDQTRMLEFLQLGNAVAKALNLPAESFTEGYRAKRSESHSHAIEGSAVAMALVAYTTAVVGHEPKDILLSELLNELDSYKPVGGMLPTNPRIFSGLLKYLEEPLRDYGIRCQWSRRTKKGERWMITYAPKPEEDIMQ